MNTFSISFLQSLMARILPTASARSFADLASRGMVAMGLLICLAIVVRHTSGNGSYLSPKTPAPYAPPITTVAVSAHRRRELEGAGNSRVDSSIRAASYARFSSALQDESSNADQQRKCREKAGTNGHEISTSLEFSDSAVSGTKLQREGLDALLAAAKAGEIDVLYFHSLSRLSRESVITLPLLKQLVYNYGVRVISVTEGIDSNDTAWELIAHIMSIVHEQYLKDLAENVLRGQEGAVEAGFSVGDYCFGYTSEPIPGSERGRRGRNPKPRKMYIFDSAKVAWVSRMFHWFVHERRSISWITRELNRLGAPKDHRATTKEWRHQYVTGYLQNRKFLGWWLWGATRNVRDPLTGKIRQVDRDPSECEKWLRHFPHLQVIDDETFEEAQRFLKINQETCAGNRTEKGKFNGSSSDVNANHPRHLLSKLIQCGGCGRKMIVGGRNGKYLFCPGYRMGVCTCQTQLRRDLAERMILDQVGERIAANAPWQQQVLRETLASWKTVEDTVPSELAAARQNLAEVERKITNLLDRIEAGHGGPELDERLSQRREERRGFAERVERLSQVDENRPPQPTASWVVEQLGKLNEVLRNATPAAAHALRDLVGGVIVVDEIREPGRKRFYLQGRFTIASSEIATTLPGSTSHGVAQEVPDGLAEEVVIDFREPQTIVVESEQAKLLYDQGLMNCEIAKQLGCSRSRLTKILKYWFESRGLVMPDGRSRRSSLEKKHLELPYYQQIADEVMLLFEQDMLLGDIAAQLGCDKNTVTSSIRWWHEQRDLPVPDGRTRRKSLEVKSKPKNKETKPGNDDLPSNSEKESDDADE